MDGAAAATTAATTEDGAAKKPLDGHEASGDNTDSPAECMGNDSKYPPTAVTHRLGSLALACPCTVTSCLH